MERETKPFNVFSYQRLYHWLSMNELMAGTKRKIQMEKRHTRQDKIMHHNRLLVLCSRRKSNGESKAMTKRMKGRKRSESKQEDDASRVSLMNLWTIDSLTETAIYAIHPWLAFHLLHDSISFACCIRICVSICVSIFVNISVSICMTGLSGPTTIPKDMTLNLRWKHQEKRREHRREIEESTETWAAGQTKASPSLICDCEFDTLLDRKSLNQEGGEGGHTDIPATFPSLFLLYSPIMFWSLLRSSCLSLILKLVFLSRQQESLKENSLIPLLMKELLSFSWSRALMRAKVT